MPMSASVGWTINSLSSSSYGPRRSTAAPGAWTLLTEGNVPDDVFTLARSQFSEEELVKLTLAIVAINGANRINVAFRAVPGNYQPAVQRAAE
jgi:alkylhydroperoxidase family enzyme